MLWIGGGASLSLALVCCLFRFTIPLHGNAKAEIEFRFETHGKCFTGFRMRTNDDLFSALERLKCQIPVSAKETVISR